MLWSVYNRVHAKRFLAHVMQIPVSVNISSLIRVLPVMMVIPRQEMIEIRASREARGRATETHREPDVDEEQTRPIGVIPHEDVLGGEMTMPQTVVVHPANDASQLVQHGAPQ